MRGRCWRALVVLRRPGSSSTMTRRVIGAASRPCRAVARAPPFAASVRRRCVALAAPHVRIPVSYYTQPPAGRRRSTPNTTNPKPHGRVRRARLITRAAGWLHVQVHSRRAMRVLVHAAGGFGAKTGAAPEETVEGAEVVCCTRRSPITATEHWGRVGKRTGERISTHPYRWCA